MIAGNLGDSDPSTLGEKRFIALSQQLVSGTVGHDQDFQQRKSRRNQFPAPAINFAE